MVSTGPGREQTMTVDDFASSTQRIDRTEICRFVENLTLGESDGCSGSNMDAKVGRETDVAGRFSKLTEESRKEPGCVMYQVHLHKTEPRRFFIYEQYKDDARSSPPRRSHFLQYAKKKLPRFGDRVEGHLYAPLTGPGDIEGSRDRIFSRKPVTSLCRNQNPREP